MFTKKSKIDTAATEPVEAGPATDAGTGEKKTGGWLGWAFKKAALGATWPVWGPTKLLAQRDGWKPKALAALYCAAATTYAGYVGAYTAGYAYNAMGDTLISASTGDAVGVAQKLRHKGGILCSSYEIEVAGSSSRSRSYGTVSNTTEISVRRWQPFPLNVLLPAPSAFTDAKGHEGQEVSVPYKQSRFDAASFSERPEGFWANVHSCFQQSDHRAAGELKPLQP